VVESKAELTKKPRNARENVQSVLVATWYHERRAILAIRMGSHRKTYSSWKERKYTVTSSRKENIQMPSERGNNGVQAMLRWPTLNLIKTIVLANLVLKDANKDVWPRVKQVLWTQNLLSFKIRQNGQQKTCILFQSQHCCKTRWIAMLRVLPPTNKISLTTNEVVTGCETLLLQDRLKIEISPFNCCKASYTFSSRVFTVDLPKNLKHFHLPGAVFFSETSGS